MEKKLVTINTSGPIRELAGGIIGPVLTPTYISIKTIYSMISGGKKIFEVNPKNRKQTILLNKENYKKDNFNTENRSDIIPKIVEENERKNEAYKKAIEEAKEAEIRAKEEAEKASVIVQEDDPNVIPIHDNDTVESVEPATSSVVTVKENEYKEPSNAAGFDIARSNKKNKKHGDFKK